MLRPAILALALFVRTALAAASATTGTAGMVVTGRLPASEAGVELLRAGGNAVDAAVGAAFALAVCEPYASGLGGGGFALVRFGSELSFLDFREVAPLGARRDMYLRDGAPDPVASREGARATAVPGAVEGYLELQARYGTLPRARVLAPAITLAEHGFAVDESFRQHVQQRLELLRQDPEAARIFLVHEKDGTWGPPPLGHVLLQRDLAATLRLLATHGASEFYRGSIAKRLVADMVRRGGLVSADDLRAYKTHERRPLVGSFRGLAVASAPLPSAGGEVVLMLLNLLETLPQGSLWHDPDALALFIEGQKRAFADRYLLGDPAFVPDPLAELVDKARAKKLLGIIGPRVEPVMRIPAGQATRRERPVSPAPARGGNNTTHISVIDRSGNAVALTTTINYVFGAGIVAEGTGILWNDEMDDFAIAPGVPNVYGVVGSEANTVAPGKIPLSSMAPTLVFDGPTPQAPVRLIVGAAGGPRIPTTVVQIILAHLFYGADIQQALTLGRVHHQHLPDVVSLEPFTLDPATVRQLETRGYTLHVDPPASNANAIAVLPGPEHLRLGAADPRGDGAAVAE